MLVLVDSAVVRQIRLVGKRLIGSCALVVGYTLIGLLVSQALWLVGITDSIICAIAMDVIMAGVLLVSLHGEDDMRLRLPASTTAICAVCGLAVIWIVGIMCSTWVSLNFVDVAFSEYGSTMYESPAALSWALGLVFAPVAEELMLRRVVYPYLRQISRVFALVTSSGLFAAMHGTLVHVPFTFLLGAYLCLIFERCGDVRVCMLLHALANLMSLVVAPLLVVPDFVMLAPVCWGLYALALVAIVWALTHTGVPRVWDS